MFSNSSFSNSKVSQSIFLSQQQNPSKIRSIRRDFSDIQNKITSIKTSPLKYNQNNKWIKQSNGKQNNKSFTKQFERIIKQMNQMTIRWTEQINNLFSKIQMLEKTVQRIQFKQKNSQSIRNISQFKSNNMLLEKINTLESQQIENRIIIKKLLNQIQQKNTSLHNLTLSFEQFKLDFKVVQEQLAKYKPLALSKQQIYQIQGLIKRFEYVKMKSDSDY